MEPLPVIEPVDIVRDRHLGLGLRLKLPMPDQLVLERTKEAFYGRIVVAITLATHAGYHPATR